MVTVDVLTTLVSLALLIGVLAIPIWALRHHDRVFPKGFDRTGWNPDGDRAGWFMTKFTWLSGGRGPAKSYSLTFVDVWPSLLIDERL